MGKLQATIRKYPEYFPWEAKYREIPQEIHEAYYKEKHGEWEIKWKAEGGKGIMELIREAPTHEKEESSKTLSEMFQDIVNAQEESRKKREENRLKNKVLWDKHYSKYKLEYRGA